MRLKTYSAPTMAKAMEQVRKEMGENAIIVSTQPGPGGRGARVTAALEEPDPDAAVFDGWADEERDGEDAGGEIAEALAFHGLPATLAGRLARAARAFENEGPVLVLATAVDTLFTFRPLSDPSPTKPLMLVGPPGAGKTIATAKLVLRTQRAGRAVAAVTADTRRAGGVEQLEAFTRILGVDLVAADSATALVKALPSDRQSAVFVDTPGVNPFSDADMETLSELVTSTAAEPVLVLAAGGDAAEAADIAVRFAAVGARRLLVTRVDACRCLGGFLAAAQAAELSFSEVGISPRVSDGLAPINPVSLARLLLPHSVPSSATPILNVKEAAS